MEGSIWWTTKTQAARQFAKAGRGFRQQQKALAEARQVTAAWRQKLPAAEVSVAIQQANAFEHSFWACLRPAWWRLRRILNNSYDFRSHVIRPRWSQVLGALQKEYEELNKFRQAAEGIAAEFRLEGRH